MEATLLPLDIVSVGARDKGDGSYDLIYPPDFRGEYDVVVKVNDQPAPGTTSMIEVEFSQSKFLQIFRRSLEG